MKTDKNNIVGILQARLGSTRLPRKVLIDIAGLPMLEVIIKRIRKSGYLSKLVVASSELQENDEIESFAQALGVLCFRGSEHDLLDRFYWAAKEHDAETVVRLTGDNVFVDGAFVDWAVERYFETECDYLSSTLDHSLPLGMSVEIFNFSILEEAFLNDKDSLQREHVTPYIYQRPERFRIEKLVSPKNYAHMRWTVDTREDLLFARTVFEHFGHHDFSWQEALHEVEKHPDWIKLNKMVSQKTL